MSIQKALQALESIAPLKIAASWDNVGLLIESLPSTFPPTPKLFLTIDLTTKVMEEVKKHPETRLIVAYHPPLFTKFRRLTLEDTKPNIAIQCISRGISVYSPHTALDNCKGGINDFLAETFQGIVLPIEPLESPIQEQEGIGYMRSIMLDQPISLETAVERVKKHLGLRHVRVAKAFNQDEIKSVGVCAGSGSSLLSTPFDLILTGELSHHDILALVENGTSVILTEHSNSERPFLKVYSEMLKSRLQDWDVVVSEVDCDPLETW